jgi:hypothetical protein
MAGIPKCIGLAFAASRCRLAKSKPFLVTLILTFAAAFLSPISNAAPITIDFESFGDSESVTTQFTGLSFVNATVLTAGISLNEFEFPPSSGANVVVDDGGAISIVFSALIKSFAANFTHSSSLTVKAFDGAANLVDSATSDFASNLALSGDAGSTPNEFLDIAFNGIKRVVIEGNLAGGSFVMDDLVYEKLSDGGGPMPEPGTTLLLLAALIAAIVTHKCSRLRADIT